MTLRIFFLLLLLFMVHPAWATQQMLYSENVTNYQTISTSASWTDCVSITGGNFTAGHDYIILGTMRISASGATVDSEYRLLHDSIVFTDAGSFQDNNGAQFWGFLVKFSQPGGGAESIILQARTQTAASSTRIYLSQLWAMDLTGLTLNTDYWWNEDTADHTSTTSFEAGASATLTANGTDDFLVIGQAAYQGGTVTDQFFGHISLYESVTNTDEPETKIEYEDTADIRNYWLARPYTPSAASHTFSVRYKHTGGAMTVLSSRIFVLRLNAFTQHAIAYSAASDAPAVTASWTTTQTASVTPDVTGNWFTLGNYVHDSGSDVNNWTDIRLQFDNGAGLASDPVLGNPSAGPVFDVNDLTPYGVFKMRSLSSGGSRIINLDSSKQSATTPPTIIDRSLISFNAELVASSSPPMMLNRRRL